MLIFIVGICLCLCMFIFIGLKTFLDYKQRQKNCTLDVLGIVVNLVTEYSMYDSTIKVYRPIINYEYGGKTYSYHHTIAKTSYKNIPIGMSVTIKIDPNNPQNAIVHI
ncbi:MAG: DUF3592 domain-containing protein [Bacilli bacterium]|nr:DUF3592 domain-containing protein [Bacilli bacterium]